MNTEAAKQTIRQGMSDIKRLTGAIIKDFRVWRANDNTSIIKFSVEKDKEACSVARIRISLGLGQVVCDQSRLG